MKELVVKYIYKWNNVLTLEASGFEVLSGLVSEYIEACNICLSCPESERSKRASKIYSLLPDKYRHENDEEDEYTRYLKVVSYVSGMTDSYALNLFRKIKGVIN